MSVAQLSGSQGYLASMDCRELHRSGLKTSGIPTREECEALWKRFGVAEEVISRSRMVAELARILAIYLNQAGLALNLDLIVACGYLHEFADRGAAVLNEAGFSWVSDVMASSLDIGPRKEGLDEAELIRFAGMLIDNDQLTTLEERFHHLLDSLAGRPRTLKLAVRKLRDAERIQGRIEATLGIPLEEILQRHKRGIHVASLEGKRAIYLVSHGAAGLQGNGAPTLSQWSSPLSAEGIRQAHALKERLRHARLSALYCSDVRCARETAEIIGKPQGLHPKERADLREVALGRWEGLTLEEVSQRYQKSLGKGKDVVHFKPQGGESFLDCTCRAIPALYAMLHGSRGNLLIVGHPWLNRVLLSQAMGGPLQDLFEINQGYGSLNVIQYSDFTFDVKMLDGAGLPVRVESARSLAN